jgi:cytochrome c-type biogenesis protein CcmH
MVLWSILALMTAAAVFAVLWPLQRRGTAPAAGGSDVVVYRDQLDELERDRKSGLIGEAEAEAARVEIARRLISAADANPGAKSEATSYSAWHRRAVMVVALVALPLGAAALYLILGSPQLPGAPQGAALVGREEASAENHSIEALIAQVEAHLKRKPEDGRGWEVLAPVYMRLGRFEDAVKARRNALRLQGATAMREADLGEALVAAANEVVTADAKAAFERALALDSGEVKARYFLGLAAEQDGKADEAARLWRGLLAGAPAGAPWVELVQAALARVEPAAAGATPKIAEPRPAGPSAEDIGAAANLPSEERASMVRGMVERLAKRLGEDGSDLEGWLRLMRSYTVLGEADKAKMAVGDARRALAGDPGKLRRIEEMAKALGLEE